VENITLLGCGTWGSALAQVLAGNGHNVNAWHYKGETVISMANSRKHPNLNGFEFHKNITFDSNLESLVKNTKCLIIAVPSHSVREVMMKILNHLTSNTIIVNVSKGIENDSLKTMSEVICEVTSKDLSKIVTLYGPSHAEEVIAKHPTTLVSASTNNDSASFVQNIFSSRVLRVYTNNDIYGVELGGSLKNVIAIATGICDGIGFGDNTKAALLTRGIAEITRLGVAMGANPETFSGLSGIGDLIATCLSKHSRNRFVGEEIGKGRKLTEILNEMNMVAEGVKTTKSVYDLSSKHEIDMPICRGVNDILFNGENPKSKVIELMTRDLKKEQNQ
jgi:glycerol-3-phosphate dehydrogenase (NAD(P)+)